MIDSEPLLSPLCLFHLFLVLHHPWTVNSNKIGIVLFTVLAAPFTMFAAAAAAAAAKSLQSCPTLCDPIDSLLPGSSVPGILQARTLEWVAISFSNAGK